MLVYDTQKKPPHYQELFYDEEEKVDIIDIIFVYETYRYYIINLVKIIIYSLHSKL